MSPRASSNVPFSHQQLPLLPLPPPPPPQPHFLFIPVSRSYTARAPPPPARSLPQLAIHTYLRACHAIMPYRANPSHPRAFPNFQFYSTLSHLKRKPPPLHPLFCFLSSLLLAAPDLVEASFLIEFRGFKNLAGPSSSLSFFLHSFTLFKLLTPLHACPMRHLSA